VVNYFSGLVWLKVKLNVDKPGPAAKKYWLISNVFAYRKQMLKHLNHPTTTITGQHKTDKG